VAVAVNVHVREVRFHSRVLSTGASPLWRESDLMNNLGMPIVGLGAWSALDLGGSELMHARDDEGASQWAVLSDPNGAAFGIIPIVSAEAIPAGGGTSRDPEWRRSLDMS
jgi:uncharacterized protein